jgi:hypothetical protein
VGSRRGKGEYEKADEGAVLATQWQGDDVALVLELKAAG